MWAPNFLLAVAALACVIALSHAAPAPMPLKSIAVVHRHGARTPLGVMNGGASCSYPFCRLTDQGKEMCLAVGKTIRDKYFAHFDLLNTEYNVSYIHSESTAVPRVVVSGEAAVMGMWPGSLPFVDYTDLDKDTKLSMWTSWPTWKIRNTYEIEEQRQNTMKTINMVGGLDVIDYMSAIYGLNCTDNPMECITVAQDTLASNRSTGAELDPVLAPHWNGMRKVVARFFAELLAYDPQDEYDNMTGSLGFPFATHIMSHMRQVRDSLQVIHHTACHDWTLIPLYSALGIWTPANMTNPRFVPRFAETLVLEQYEDVAAGTGTYVKALWGYPNQAAVSKYTLNLTEASLWCIDGTGGYYQSTSVPNGCLFEDLWRYINSTAPQSEAGICYATEQMLEDQQCLDYTAPSNTSRCYFYRDKCPQEPCARVEGAIADVAEGFACALPAQTDYLPTTIAALIIPFMVFGSALGFYLTPKVFGSKFLASERRGEGDRASFSESTPIVSKSET